MLGAKYALLLGAFGTPAHQVHAERVVIHRLSERSPACTSVKLGVAVDSTNVKTGAALAPSFEVAPGHKWGVPALARAQEVFDDFIQNRYR